MKSRLIVRLLLNRHNRIESSKASLVLSVFTCSFLILYKVKMLGLIDKRLQSALIICKYKIVYSADCRGIMRMILQLCILLKWTHLYLVSLINLTVTHSSSIGKANFIFVYILNIQSEASTTALFKFFFISFYFLCNITT